MRTRAWFAAAALIAAVALMPWYWRQPQQPTHRGRPLSYWVQSLGLAQAALSHVRGDRAEAEAAIRLAGTNAVPHLVRWFAEDPPGPFGRAYARLLYVINRRWYYDYAPFLRPPGAGEALHILGPQAKAAIPELSRLMNDSSHYVIAERAALLLPYLGPEALPPLAATLTNDYAIRYLVINQIRVMGTNALPIVPQLVRLLQDKDRFCAMAAAAALGDLGRFEPDLAVPALTNCLHASESLLQITAAEALLHFTNAPPAARATLLRQLTNSDLNISVEAANSLRRIAPELLTNAPGH